MRNRKNKYYIGNRYNHSAELEVEVVVYHENHFLIEKYFLTPKESQKLFNHSPDGFEWGYGGSGPAQLSLAILLDFTGDKDISLKNYQNFKYDIISNFDRESFNLSEREIKNWLKYNT